jgi:DNA modification methylase
MKYPCLLTKKINEISSAKYNPRKITDEAMGRLTKSLAEFGNIQPITWNVRTGNVVGGHQRLKVYKAMGKTEVDVWAVDLDEQKEKAANIALNKLSGEFDMPMLKDILEEIDTGDLDMEITGFGMDEIALMMEDAHPEVTEDEVPEVPVDATTKPGDLWILGEHRVLCGDSTRAEDVARLMNGEKADMVFTDPPYGINAVSKSGVLKQKYKTDILGDASTSSAKDCFNLIYSLYPQAIHIWWGANYYSSCLPDSECWIVWDKNNGGSDQMDCELAWSNARSVVRQFTKASEKINRVHPTQKPLELISWSIGKFANDAKLICDYFLGSGATMIASHKLNRKCYGIEMSPNYCDVIVKRWENLTGKKATLAK